MDNTAKNCKTCAHAIFDELWGDYKCKVREIRVRVPEHENCECYKRKPKKGDSTCEH